ncbi:hypothetical protein J6590_013941 [Homalodisca vitripennis]|nr:hypothetical protein J6590_013941 [Homalodisca vitripennis]
MRRIALVVTPRTANEARLPTNTPSPSRIQLAAAHSVQSYANIGPIFHRDFRNKHNKNKFAVWMFCPREEHCGAALNCQLGGTDMLNYTSTYTSPSCSSSSRHDTAVLNMKIILLPDKRSLIKLVEEVKKRSRKNLMSRGVKKKSLKDLPPSISTISDLPPPHIPTATLALLDSSGNNNETPSCTCLDYLSLPTSHLYVYNSKPRRGDRKHGLNSFLSPVTLFMACPLSVDFSGYRNCYVLNTSAGVSDIPTLHGLRAGETRSSSRPDSQNYDYGTQISV